MSTELIKALQDLRNAVTAAAANPAPDGAVRTVRAAMDAPSFHAATLHATPGTGGVDTVSLEPAHQLRVADLEGALGPARRLPRGPGIGRPVTLQFDQTVPADGATGATVLAEVDDEQRVTRLIVRADSFA